MRFIQKDLNEQVVVLFGGSSGIGRATVIELLKKGAKVTATARDEKGLTSLKNDAEKTGFGDNLLTLIADATKMDEVKLTAEETVSNSNEIVL
jgi:NAD(P)-dependent dehydrogenase (short-subunit alcohol dehydrogenase family)